MTRAVPYRSGLAFVVTQVVLQGLVACFAFIVAILLLVQYDNSDIDLPYGTIVMTSILMFFGLVGVLYWFYLLWFTLRYRNRLRSISPFGPGSDDPRLFARDLD